MTVEGFLFLFCFIYYFAMYTCSSVGTFGPMNIVAVLKICLNVDLCPIYERLFKLVFTASLLMVIFYLLLGKISDIFVIEIVSEHSCRMD